MSQFEEREQPGVDRNYTFHVDQGKFDLMLLQHAHQLGATVYEGVRVHHVDFSEPGQPHIHFMIGKKNVHTNVHLVVDASERRTLFGRTFTDFVCDACNYGNTHHDDGLPSLTSSGISLGGDKLGPYITGNSLRVKVGAQFTVPPSVVAPLEPVVA